jgi:hypothetical protein
LLIPTQRHFLFQMDSFLSSYHCPLSVSTLSTFFSLAMQEGSLWWQHQSHCSTMWEVFTGSDILVWKIRLPLNCQFGTKKWNYNSFIRLVTKAVAVHKA